MVDVALLLGFTFSGAALGLLLLRSGGLILALFKLGPRTKSDPQEATTGLPLNEPVPIEPPAELQSHESHETRVEVGAPVQAKDAQTGLSSQPVESCPCGLVLPANALMEHLQSTGHVGHGSSVNIRTGKIWDLEQATVEQTSPDCYKCGKPVKGLKRVGKTIYVSHAGCLSSSPPKMKIRPKKAVGLNDSRSPVRQRGAELSMGIKCPICWEPVQETGSATALSTNGSMLRFHNRCLDSNPWKNFA